LPGSAIFVDEAHAAMPAWMWPQHWLWMNELTQTCGCRYVLASGSLSKFWELPEFVGKEKKKISDIVPVRISLKANEFEKNRVQIKKLSSVLNRDTFIEQIEQTPGPHLIIMNTVQSSAVLADYLRNAGKDVRHLSTAIAPVHRKPIIDQIKLRLKNKQHDRDWILVATSCVEAGLDFSFRTAFRECSTVASLYQASGRLNRHGEDKNAEIYSFRTLDPLFNHHPAFETSSEIVDDFLDNGMFDRLSPAECVTRAMKREVGQEKGRTKAEKLKNYEKGQDYPEVSKLSRIIDAPTRLVVVDAMIIEMLLDYKQRRQVTSQMLVNHSVQVWSKKLDLLCVKPFPFSDELFYLDESLYDAEFLGYMKAMLPVLKMNSAGFMIIDGCL
jgi:CRISPR-associated endonuclease/helicase Cas3